MGVSGHEVGVWGRPEGGNGSGTSVGWQRCRGMGPWGREGAGHQSWERGLRGFVPGERCQCRWGSVGGRARKRCCGKKLICTIISQKDKASVRVGGGQLPTGPSPDKHREEEVHCISHCTRTSQGENQRWEPGSRRAAWEGSKRPLCSSSVLVLFIRDFISLLVMPCFLYSFMYMQV